MTPVETAALHCILWAGDKVRLIDQTLLPDQEVWLEVSDYRAIIRAIKEMRVRGAPAIGVAGAYAMVLAAADLQGAALPEFLGRLEVAASEIRQARPTGANLGWAVRHLMAVAKRASSPQEALADLTAEALRIQQEDEEANRAIGRLGAELLRPGSAVLTHCNTGALATGGYGTALGIVFTAWGQGKLTRVYVTETRPLLQGARLTAWELARGCIEATLVPDSAAGEVLRRGLVQAVIVGADRIAANGDSANKIGTYSLAVLSKENGVPFFVAAPTSTIDMSLPSGQHIPLEERAAEEVTHLAGRRVAAQGVSVLNAAFDVTPARYITSIVTEKGVATAPYTSSLMELTRQEHG